MADTRPAVRQAAMHVAIKRARVLVVGANTGANECRQFIEAGALEVHGLDVIDNVGREFAHDRVVYHRMSIEQAELPSDSYDLVFCFATMEHVPNVAAAFSEMVRLTKPGGMVYSMAAPLWHSAVGHHMALFDNHPWIHLVKSREEIIDFARSRNLERSPRLEQIVDYMLNDRFFNKRPADNYLKACDTIRGIRMVKNAIDRDHRSLDHPNAKEAMRRGISNTDLLGISHRFIAHKAGGGLSLRQTAVRVGYGCRDILKRYNPARATAIPE